MEYYDGASWTGLANRSGGLVGAFVNFNGIGASATISSSANVSSVTRTEPEITQLILPPLFLLIMLSLRLQELQAHNPGGLLVPSLPHPLLQLSGSVLGLLLFFKILVTFPPFSLPLDLIGNYYNESANCLRKFRWRHCRNYFNWNGAY
jgi:hypothetical protein